MAWNSSCQQDDSTFYYSEYEDGETRPRNGVGIIISRKLTQYVIGVTPISDRLTLLHIQGAQCVINITVAAVSVLLQKSREMNRDVFICFIDYEKAFDNVQHEKLIKVSERIGIEGNDLQVIRNLYWNQEAELILGANRDNVDFEVQRGVR